MEKICSGMVVIKNGMYQIIQLDQHFRTRKYGIWDSGNEKILDTICEYSKEFPNQLYGVLKLDTITVKQLDILKSLKYFNDFIFIVPAAHYNCKLPDNVRILYASAELNYLPLEHMKIVSFENKINKIVWRGQYNNHAETPCFRTLICNELAKDERCDCKRVNASWQPPFNPDYRMPQSEQLKYKGIFVIDGGGWATTISWALGSGCVPLICSMYWVGLQYELVPWKHYVPINPDMSDLHENVNWIFTHDEECKEIIKNALEFYNSKMTNEYMFKKLKEITFVSAS